MLTTPVRDATDLEHYLSRLLALTLLTLAVLQLVLTGSVPLTSSLRATTAESDPTAPYVQPTMTITFLYHAACAFYSYALWTSTRIFAFTLGAVGSGVLAAMGLWCILFAAEAGRVSKKTGADKRVSGFPFGNVEADKRKGKKF